jgi:hypothetical protein
MLQPGFCAVPIDVVNGDRNRVVKTIIGAGVADQVDRIAYRFLWRIVGRMLPLENVLEERDQSLNNRVPEGLQRIHQKLPLVEFLLVPHCGGTHGGDASRIGSLPLRDRLLTTAIVGVDART